MIHKKESETKQAGFTLIELMVVIAIMVVLSYQLFVNFGSAGVRDKQALRRQIFTMEAHIRRVQSLALSAQLIGGVIPCAYGVHYLSPTSFFVFAKIKTVGLPCSGLSKIYNPGQDSIVSTHSLTEAKAEFKNTYVAGEDFRTGKDIVFEAPIPSIYIDGDLAVDGQPLSVTIGIINKTCPNSCMTLLVYPNGRFEEQ